MIEKSPKKKKSLSKNKRRAVKKSKTHNNPLSLHSLGMERVLKIALSA